MTVHVRRITQTLEADVLVAGGGPAGVAAAISAARHGAKVVLCQDRPMLGGNASSEIRMHIVGADQSGGRGEALAVEAREGGLIEEIRLETAVTNPQRSPSMLDLILYDRCRQLPNLTLLLNTAVVGAEVVDGHVTHAIAERASTEDVMRIAAKVFIDATGDGRLGLEAGAPFQRGREARSLHGEPHGQPQADDLTLGSTLLFLARRHDRPMPFTAPSWARRFTEADLRLRPHARPGVDTGLEYGYWWVEWGGTLDTIADNEAIRDELMAIMLGVWDHIKNGDRTLADYPNPDSHGASHWALSWFSFVPGKRESRRFIGHKTLTELDVFESRTHDDAIAYGGWPIDVHPPAGVDQPDEPPCTPHEVPHLYDIPLGCCVSRALPNLMFAGRNISATHLGFASTRVMATCFAMGQGVGVAAAHGVAQGLSPADLLARPAELAAIQQKLLRDDAFLLGVVNQDSADLARVANVTASSSQPDGAPANLLTGQTRAVHGRRGAKPGRVSPGTHRWMSDPAAGLPAWVQLSWDTPVTIGRLQLVFDTGMHRALTLTHSDAYVDRMCWGRPQPETIADYRLHGLVEGQWQVLLEVKGNYQRLRVHDLPAPVHVSAVRFEALATHGLDHARLFELRAYPPGR